MSKTQRIADLEREVDQLHAEFVVLSTRISVLEEAQREPAVGKPSLVEQVRTEFHAKWDWLLDAVGA